MNATSRRQRSSALARQLRAENRKFITNCAIDQRALLRMLALLQEHCKEAYLAINEIQRAWMCIDDTAALLDAIYGHLYEIYPPRFPQILREMLSPEEVAVLDDPVLA